MHLPQGWPRWVCEVRLCSFLKRWQNDGGASGKILRVLIQWLYVPSYLGVPPQPLDRQSLLPRGWPEAPRKALWAWILASPGASRPLAAGRMGCPGPQEPRLR